MTDQEHIAAINAATRSLNAAQDAARADGLLVSTHIESYKRRPEFEFGGAIYLLLPTISRRLQS